MFASVAVVVVVAAAPVSGRVFLEGARAPAAGATVELFEPANDGIGGCQKTKQANLGECACAGPIQDALVERLAAGRATVSPVSSTKTSSDGSFKFDDVVGSGPWALIATSADGRSEARMRVTRKSQELVLTPVRPLRVSFSGLTNDARAWLIDGDTGGALALAPDGNELALPRTPGGSQWLISKSDKSMVRIDSVYAGRLGGQERPNTVLELVAPHEVHLQLSREGKPFAGEVIVDEWFCPTKITTDDAGKATFLARTMSPMFSTQLEGWALRGWNPVGPHSFQLDLKPSATLELTAVTAAGAPAVNALVEGCPENPLDARGHTVCTGLVPGAFNLTLSPPWFVVSDVPTALKPGVNQWKVQVVKGVTLQGRVIDGRGAAVSKMFVELLFSEKAKNVTPAMRKRVAERRFGTDAKGTFTVEGIPASEYRVSATSWDKGDAEIVAKAPGSVTLEVDDSQVLTGAVTEASGLPLAGVSVSYMREHGDGRIRQAQTGPDGRFRLVVVGKEPLTVYANRNVPGVPAWKSEELTPSRSMKPLEIVFKAITTTKGVVTSASGVPLANVKISGVVTGSAAAASAVPAYRPSKSGLPERAPVNREMFFFLARTDRSFKETTTAADGTFELAIPGSAVLVVEGLKEPVWVKEGEPAKIVVSP